MFEPPDLPDLRPAGRAVIAALTELVGDDRVELDERRRTEASRDHAWLSPVLTEDLPDVIADVVVRPGSTDQLASVLDLAHQEGVAVTPRGKGTGNYGQAAPLAAGIVLDLTDLRTVHDVSEGWIHADAGASFTRLEAAARATGQQLRMFPSTVGSTLGGFLSGGAGGTGSLAHGFLWEGDTVGEVTVLGCVDGPEPVSVAGAERGPYLHAYGTAGILTSARFALEPAVEWTALFASFDSLTDAGHTALGLAADLDTVPRNVSVGDADLSSVLADAHPAIRAGRVSLRAVVATDDVGPAREAVTRGDGTVEAAEADGVGLCISLSYNHVTLRAKRRDPAICHLQISGPPTVERPEEVAASLPGGMVHVDLYARDGRPGFGGLHLSRFEGRERLADGAAALAELGVFVMSPHTWRLGGHGPLDEMVAAARTMDPRGLLNPGKLPR